jgi:hypothetical protein
MNSNAPVDRVANYFPRFAISCIMPIRVARRTAPLTTDNTHD